MFNLLKKIDNRGFTPLEKATDFNPVRERSSLTGFTLIEILVALLIFVVIFAVIFAVYIAGTDMWDIARHQADLQAQARESLSFMMFELRSATRTSTQNPSPNLSIPSAPNNNSITFYLPEDNDGDGLITDSNGDIEWDTGNPINYQYNVGQNKLSRFEMGQETIFSQDASDVQFFDINIDPSLFLDELKIILTFTKSTPKQRDISVTTSVIVNTRN